jgi:hypothetical protein
MAEDRTIPKILLRQQRQPVICADYHYFQIIVGNKFADITSIDKNHLLVCGKPLPDILV